MIRLLAILVQLTAVCFGGGVLKLSFSQFSHDFQCDLMSQCDLKFVVCVDHGNGSVNNLHEECKYLREEVQHLDPISIHFKQWPGIVVFKLVILDEDLFEHELMDYMYAYLSNKPGERMQMELKNKSQLMLTTELRCDFEYFGGNCSVFCSPKDDDTGHFKCNRQTGEHICLKGWGGPSCTLRSAISSATEYKNFSGSEVNKPPNPIISESFDGITPAAPTPELADDPSDLVNEIGNEILSEMDIIFDNETEETTLQDPSTPESISTDYDTLENDTVVEAVTEIQFSKENNMSDWSGNFSEDALTFSFPLNDTAENVSKLSPDRLQYRFQTVLKRFVAEDMNYVKVNVSIIVESLQIIITIILDVSNETILQRVKSSITEQKSNIKNTFMKEAFTEGNHIHPVQPKSKSVPEWAIILVVVAVVFVVLITMRQSHKYCVSKNLMKPKELDEEPDNDLVQSTALNFTNPIYSRPKD